MQNSTAGESKAAELHDKQCAIDPERAELDDDQPVTHAVKDANTAESIGDIILLDPQVTSYNDCWSEQPVLWRSTDEVRRPKSDEA